jgi:hypothetical protein
VSGIEEITSDEFHSAAVPFPSTPGSSHLPNQVIIYVTCFVLKIQRNYFQVRHPFVF